MSSPLDALMGVLGLGAPSGAPPATPGATLPPPQSAAPPAPDPQEVVVTAKKKDPPVDLQMAPKQDVGPLDTSVPNFQVNQPAPPPQPYTPHTVPQGQYDNTPEANAIGQVAQQYNPDGPGGGGHISGLAGMVPSGMPGGGTLRNLLGTLGDAFLIQSGHQPMYQQRLQREQIANAAAGFEQDPNAAASRIAATGAPGSMQDAQTMEQTAQNADLRKATLQANTDYRNQGLAIRQEQADSLAAQRQQATEGQARSRMGAMLAAGAQAEQNGQKGAYASAQKAAGTLGAKYIKDFNTDLEPNMQGDVSQYNAGYGLTGGQQSTAQYRQQHLAQQGADFQQADATRNRGIAVQGAVGQGRNHVAAAAEAVSNPQVMQNLKTKQDQGIPLTAAEQAIWTHGTHVSSGRAGGGGLNIPGLSPQGGGQAASLPPANRTGFPAPGPTAQPQQGGGSTANPIHTYPSGRQTQWNGRQWVPYGKH